SNDSTKPKCYVLDMFPYPSGAGLHVGHPLGYIASDIYARYKRLCGFNVLHPMGYDAFGLPAEQYAIETGQHPINTTEKNIARYREQLDNIGFCYDWDREVRTSDPKYYKWTQWIFLQLFHSWYDRHAQKAKSISKLIKIFEQEGNINQVCPGDDSLKFNATQWQAFSAKEKRQALMHYRLAYLDYANVWWCEQLGTVLANDEVVNGVSERGGFPVEKRKMRQWFLRITEYAERLLQSLDDLEWTEAMKEMQRNWIGKSMGAEIDFSIKNATQQIKVFTTRPDTIFGVDFMVLAPEHDLVEDLTTTEQKEAIEQYKKYVQSRSDRERMAEVKQVSGCFTGSYVIHPFTGKEIPVWIAEYVLVGYGTGAIMAVPSGDSRDHAFATHFQIPITNIFGAQYNGEAAYESKETTLENSDFVTGLSVKDAAIKVIEQLTAKGLGKPKINYKLRDAGFSRQRYWGEP
ncbi:MAG: leucine--tRNA ligase, partial [Gammaproteobacteria bacterium]|nr:leucine--tRNA ligase [Gammaproteobacteria bacterium]